jgi:sugar lactone lactonase YvrE
VTRRSRRTYEVELCADVQDVVGESPCPIDDAVLWLDLRREVLHRLDPGGVVRDLGLPSETTAVTAADAGAVTLTTASGLVRLAVEDGAQQPLLPAWFDPATHRTNDATTDALGRLWVGWFRRDRTPGAGAIGVVASGRLHDVVTGVTMPNGLGWLPDGRTLVFADTGASTLSTVEVDVETGAPVGPPRELVRLEREAGLVDGLAVDVDGCIWVALWGGGAVRRYDAGGRLVAEVELPAKLATSCAFGGPELRDLYVTTASSGLAEPSRHDGALYRFAVDTPGLAVARHRRTA